MNVKVIVEKDKTHLSIVEVVQRNKNPSVFNKYCEYISTNKILS